MKPRGFGAPFWAARLRALLPRLSPAVMEACRTSSRREDAGIMAVLEELIAQTRLDEAMHALRIARGAGDMPDAVERLLAREADHRRDLRAAQKAKR